ncbi:rhomboid family intramembrane serine protease [soil metagenome]
MSNITQKPGFFGGFALFPPVIKSLLIANIAVFVIFNYFFSTLSVGEYNLGDLVFRYGALYPLNHGFLPWQIFTYMFMHANFMHLFFNMFALWMFGMELENLWGSKKFLFYYLICGIGAALANLFIAPLFGNIGPTVGASGSIYGVLVAFGYIFPNRNIYLYFFIPLKAKYLIILYMAIEVFSLSNSSSNIAHAAHLGGAVVGLIYLIITNKGMNNFMGKAKSTGKNVFENFTQKKEEPYNGKSDQYKPTTAQKTHLTDIKNAAYDDYNNRDFKNEADNREKDSQEKIDAILDKLSAGGYASLTAEEKRILFHESKKLR